MLDSTTLSDVSSQDKTIETFPFAEIYAVLATNHTA
jgi:hypothetical protein